MPEVFGTALRNILEGRYYCANCLACLIFKKGRAFIWSEIKKSADMSQ